MRHALALLIAAALGFLLGALWQGESTPPHGQRSAERERADEPVARGAPASTPIAPSGEAPSSRSGDEPPLRPASEPEASATRSGIRVDVLGLDGAPAPSARVHVDQRDSVAWTPDAPFVPAGPGAHLLRARTPSDGARSADELVVVRPGDPSPTVTLRLLPRPSLHVTFTLPPGIVIADVSFYVCRFQGDERPRLGDPQKLTVTNGYEYRWRDARPGRYLVAAHYRHIELWKRQARPVEVEVEVKGDSAIAVSLELPPPDPACVPLHIFGPDGAPVHDSRVRLGARGPNGDLYFEKHGFARRDDGALLLPPIRPEIPAGWPRVVEIRAPAFGYRLDELPADRTVRLSEPGWIEATLEGAEGADIVTAIEPLPAPSPDTRLYLEHHIGLAHDGRQAFGPLQPGRYVVVVIVGSKLDVVRAEVAVASGQTTRVVLKLPDPR